MSDCKVVHETIIRDIVDIITDVKNSDELKGFSNRGRSFKSIAQASSNLTLVFPVLTTKNVNIENATMISKAVERKAVVMLQMLFSALSITDTDNGIEYINQFHTNLKIDDNVSVDGFIDAMDKFVISAESSKIDLTTYNKVKNDLRNLNYFLPDNVSESSLEDYKITNNSYFGESVVLEAKGKPKDMNIRINMPPVYGGGGNRNKDKADLLKNQLLPNDVKKANELVPTTMIINFVSTNNSGEAIKEQIVIGVKAKLYPIDSADIMKRMILKHQDKNGFLKFLKASTREISFMRDFLFAIDKAKLDALSQSKRGSSSKIWKILERRSLKSKFRRTLGMVNDASAITTLVITQEEVEYLKKTENIDLENPNTIRPIMESYNFMGVCVVDEALEVAKFIFDTGDDIYENLSFSSLEREGKDMSTKKIINLMTKMR